VSGAKILRAEPVETLTTSGGFLDFNFPGLFSGGNPHGIEDMAGGFFKKMTPLERKEFI
jgi:hypothetical protein